MSNPVLDFTQAPKKIILDLVNADNAETLSVPLTEADVTFGDVNAEGSDTRNTSLVLTAVVGSAHLGEQTIYYNRLDLDAVFTSKSDRFIKNDALTTIDQVVTLINDRYKINLTAADFTIGDFPTWEMLPEEEHDITVTAKPESLIFIGASKVTLYLPQVPLAVAITNNTLNGLTYNPPAEA